MKREKARPEFGPDKVLNELTWEQFSAAVPKMNESELLHALNREHQAKRRTAYLLRLHRKYNQVRYNREQREYGYERRILGQSRSSR